jgi:hypothetical protein
LPRMTRLSEGEMILGSERRHAAHEQEVGWVER